MQHKANCANPSKWLLVEYFPDIDPEAEGKDPIDEIIKGTTDDEPEETSRRLVDLNDIKSVIETPEGLAQLCVSSGESFVILAKFSQMMQILLNHEQTRNIVQTLIQNN